MRVMEREKKEAESGECEQWARELFENAPDAIFLADMDTGRILDANAAAARLLSKQRDQIIGLHHTALHPPRLLDDVKAKFADHIRQSTQLRQGYPMESVVLRSDGREVPVEIRARAVEAGGRRVMQEVFRDITEIKQFGEALKRAESRYRLLFEEAPIGIFSSTLDGRFIEVNSSIARMLGYETPEEVLRSVKDIARDIYVHPERRAEITRILMSGERVVNSENLFRRKNGEQFIGSLNMKMIYDKKGQPSFLLGHVENITQRKKTEAELAFRNAILSTQQEVSLDGILVVDDEGDIISFNRRFIEMWEIPPAVIEARSDNAALQSVLDKVADPAAFIERVNYLYENREEKSREDVLLRDGRVFDRYSAPMFGEDGRYYGRVWFFRDSTGK